MDLKQLYHNPEELDDFELSVIRGKLRQMQMTPWVCAGSLAFGMAIFDRSVLRMARNCPMRLSAAAVVGYLVGVNAVSNVSSVVARDFDADILRAHDERQLRSTLNLAGLGGNWTNMKHNENVKSHNKPY